MVVDHRVCRHLIETAAEPLLEVAYCTQKAAGVHLGLYLSRRIVEAHGGELYVDWRPGEGNELAQRSSKALEIDLPSVRPQAPPHHVYYYVIVSIADACGQKK
jgi:hypothetical protein